MRHLKAAFFDVGALGALSIRSNYTQNPILGQLPFRRRIAARALALEEDQTPDLDA
jgi:hypothetical protein